MTEFDTAKKAFLLAIEQDDHVFADTLAFIEKWYQFTPVAFQNGPVSNSAEQNQGSCKVLALSMVLNLSKEQTLKCFGEHYREVLATPDVDNHHNLRYLQREGTNDVSFDKFPLTAR